MYRITPIEPVDYLIIGHVTQDVTPNGLVLGGTASYAALTARAIGYRVGIVTACAADIDLSSLQGIPIVSQESEFSTTFENIQTPEGRVQILHHRSLPLDLSMVPETWRTAPIVHLGPVAQEVDIHLVHAFPRSFVGLTPQGWMRGWDQQGHVHFDPWPEAAYVLEKASAAVMSIEDIAQDESYVDEFAAYTRVMAITEGANGARVFWNGDQRRVRPPGVKEVDSIGAGDIFAAAFFARMVQSRDPWESARYANCMASTSVTRKGLAGIPTMNEVVSCMVEVVKE